MEKTQINFKVGDLVTWYAPPIDCESDCALGIGKVKSIDINTSEIILCSESDGFYTSHRANGNIRKIEVGDTNTEFDTIETIVEEGLIEEYRKLRLHGNKRD